MFIDSHAHIFPRRKAPLVLQDLLQRGNIPHYTNGMLDGLIRSMESAGIGLSLISRITTKKKNVNAVNRWLLNCRRPNVLPLATVHPDFPVTPDYLNTLRTQGFKGIKLHPDYQGFYVDDPRMYPFYDAAQQVRIPVLFHAGLDRGLPPPVHAMPKRLLKIHRQFPQMVMILAHMGGEDNYEETETCLLGENIYLDTAFVLRIMETETLKRFFRKHPIERILFGSDSPFTDQAAELNYLLDLPFLTATEKEKIAGGNAADLMLGPRKK
ncbi:amidohydrolase family protein [Desulfosarcina ovata]|uniref:Amidohydrolase n=1 Tax=Desulfosarcina ovata subsp. ovata TaxID=2752305 RepID=A0A5K8A862_9BACT|nr:amidohydrolase family protein [Desulfosarcina ovata]BBO88725.1 amidohydrolase [Desulfosarcina ovata subsp. ovata]